MMLGSPRRPQLANFYAGVRICASGQERTQKIDAPDVRLGRIATKRLISRDSAVGYKRRFGATRSASALRPAQDIRTLNLRS